MADNETRHVEVTAVETNALGVMERAAIDVQVATAHTYPRSLAKFQTNVTNMIKANKKVAEACVYNRPVGKEGGKMKFAEGPSIRLAEIAASCYGNLRVATIITEVTPRYVKAQGVAFDLESNYAVKKDCIETTVTRSGAPYSERMRVVVAKACQSKALRDAVFGVIPRVHVTGFIETAKKVMLGDRTIDEMTPGLMKWIKKLDIKPQRVWDALGIQGPAELTMDHFITLGGLKTAIEDSEITVKEVFPPSMAEQEAGSAAEKIKDHFAGKGKAEEKKKAKKTKPKKETSTPQKPPTAPVDQAPEGEEEPAGPAEQEEPAPPMDTSPDAPEEPAAPPDKYKCLKCQRKFPTMKDGKCPYCIGNKIVEL